MSNISIHDNLVLASKYLIEAQSRSVLLVEDTAAHAALIRRAIDTTIWNFSHVTRGQVALQIFKNNPSSIVLIDLSLPDYDGLELMAHFKELNPSAPIIIVTSLEDVRKSVKAMQEGAWDYVVKGEVETFQTALKDAIEKAWRSRLDKAERKLASECKIVELIKTERLQAIEELIMGVCAEVNNPLSGLITFTDLLKKNSPNEKDSELLEELSRSAHKVALAVNKLRKATTEHSITDEGPNES
ncbi:MAG TPA: response regulator [Oligoflexia bacterium]|nr:response regulator [Oligoflexia bacterium]HMP47659.1 response regulator [Oligoflexia bacterium]